jgi:hypothetical protein
MGWDRLPAKRPITQLGTTTTTATTAQGSPKKVCASDVPTALVGSAPHTRATKNRPEHSSDGASMLAALVRRSYCCTTAKDLEGLETEALEMDLHTPHGPVGCEGVLTLCWAQHVGTGVEWSSEPPPTKQLLRLRKRLGPKVGRIIKTLEVERGIGLRFEVTVQEPGTETKTQSVHAELLDAAVIYAFEKQNAKQRIEDKVRAAAKKLRSSVGMAAAEGDDNEQTVDTMDVAQQNSSLVAQVKLALSNGPIPINELGSTFNGQLRPKALKWLRQYPAIFHLADLGNGQHMVRLTASELAKIRSSAAATAAAPTAVGYSCDICNVSVSGHHTARSLIRCQTQTKNA